MPRGLEIRAGEHATCLVAIERAVSALQRAAAEHRCRVEVAAEEQYRACRLAEDEVMVRLATRALRKRGLEPVALSSGGGSDAHVLSAGGRSCLNLAHGVENFHSADEHVAVADLALMREVTLELIRQATLAPAPVDPVSGSAPGPDRA